MSRLIGLETEYGIYLDPKVESLATDGSFLPNSDADGTPDPETSVPNETRSWYQRWIEQLAQASPLVRSRGDEQTYFIANGGSVSYETRSADPMRSGLLEGATPECKSPLTLLSYQGAQDELFSEATYRTFKRGTARLLKNSIDAEGHLYGQQENYEVEIAKGWRLVTWRIGLLAMVPLVLAYKGCSRIWMATIFALAFVVRMVTRCFLPQEVPDGAGVRNDSENNHLSARWVRIAVVGMRFLHAPLALYLNFLIQTLVLIPHRKHLSAFFATRAIFDGVGHFDRSGRFWLGAKASTITSMIGFGNYWGERPVFVTGHWLQAICTDPWHSLQGWRDLFRKHQRIQISLGDSTPNSMVEYMRIGVTDLVLDMIESQAEIPLPRLSHPVHAFQRFAGDWMLLYRATDRSRKALNAIDIQREYLKSVRKFLQRHWQVPAEAWQILHQWQAIIDQLQESRSDANAKQWLLGRVDWISKKWLLDQIDPSADWNVRKKVDLRFHELSNEGYQRKLNDALKLPPLIDADQLERARRNPPQGTPATQRGYFIREFASLDEPLRADWDAVEFGKGRNRRIVSLRKPK